MIDPIKIGKAWKNKIIHTDEQKEIADERMAVCQSCPNRSSDNLLNVEVCDLCLCPLVAKIYTDESDCPLQKWSR